LNIATTAAKECGIPQSKIFVLGFHGEPVPEGHQSWTKLLLCGEKDWVQVEDQIIRLLLSSVLVELQDYQKLP
jgi:hypothetical protein